jgi:ribosome maturation factor RimP
MSEQSQTIEGRVKAIAERVAQYEGLEVVEVEWKGSGRGLLRIFVDKPDGVLLDDCAAVSRQVSTILDAEDVVPGGAYQLEVSSPGLDRKLLKLSDYQRFAGHRVKVKLKAPLDGRQQFTGVLSDPAEDGFVLELTPAETVRLKFDDVQQTRLVVEI